MASLNFIKANAELAKKIYKIISKEQDENALFCPLSAYIVLAMAYQGAAGKTAEKIADLLGVTTDRQKSPVLGCKALVDKLINNIADLTFYLANKIYVNKTISLKKALQAPNQQFFTPEVESLDFGDKENTANTINRWVETKTDSTIKDIIEPSSLDASKCLIFISACYFKSAWKIEFAEEDTSTQSFFITEEEEVDCQMMYVKGDFEYTDSSELDARILELHYRADNVSLLIILPNKISGIVELENNLSNVDLSSLMQEEQRHFGEVEVYLPKFKIEATTDLKLVLQKMGFEMFESGETDFSEMVEDCSPVCINDIIQKTLFDVNEQGTEAGASTYGELMLMSGPERFSADHPFMFILQFRGDEANTVLFIGKVVKPDNEVDDEDDDEDDDD